MPAKQTATRFAHFRIISPTRKLCRECPRADVSITEGLRVLFVLHWAGVLVLGRESNPYGLRRGVFVTLRLSPPAA